MDGIRIAGKAFAVFEDLRQFAEQNKGKTVAEALAGERKARLERAEAKQFGMTVEKFRGYVK
jgi:hypothetical protein